MQDHQHRRGLAVKPEGQWRNPPSQPTVVARRRSGGPGGSPAAFSPTGATGESPGRWRSTAPTRRSSKTTWTSTVHTLAQPVIVGGCQLVITMSQSGYTTGEKDLGNSYTQLTQALSGIANSTARAVSQSSVFNSPI